MPAEQQVQVGSKLPNVQLVLPSAADPEAASFMMTEDLFNGMLDAAKFSRLTTLHDLQSHMFSLQQVHVATHQHLAAA